MHHRKLRIFAIPALALLLTACGFQLRGAAAIPAELHQMSLNCSNELSKVLCQTLSRQLKLNNVNLVGGSVADYTLSVTTLESNRRALSINSRAVAAEYEVTNKATFNLITKDKTTIIEPTSVTAKQSYRYDENSVISKSREEEQVKDLLNKQLASKIISRLSPYNKSKIEQIRADLNK